ncbi:MAG: cytochrome b/b6 domain-containing protein [Parvibaculaceae bacterium]
MSEDKPKPAHPLFVRITHWINALAMLMMITSGWRIYNASPIFDFSIPSALTLGGWLGGALQWHFAAMWLLVTNGLAYLVYGLITGHLRRSLLPLTPRSVWNDTIAALKFKLDHGASGYNAVQKLLYIGVLVIGVVIVLSGLAIWKPVQFGFLATLFGGYEGARIVHFLCMSGIVAFVVVHLALVLLVPSVLLPMITGRAPAPHTKGAAE